ncbi:MAG: hypothetical protein AAB637_00805 [Patescibacteria group bacterium]
MKTYNIISPSLVGILSDDYLYFEGVSRPEEIYMIRDNNEDIFHKNIDVLEKYFNDVYNLLLRKLSAFATFEYITDEEETKLQALLQELIKVKKLIEGVTKNAEK